MSFYKPGSDCAGLRLKTTEDENKEGATASLAAANGISIDDAAASV